MNLAELLDCDANKLKSMTDDVLLAHYKQYLDVTRPELAPKPNRAAPSPIDFERKQKVAQLASLGIDIDLSFLKKKKK